MAVVFSEDDRSYFIKFTDARNLSCLNADMLGDVYSVLFNKKHSPATRLAAAKLLCKDNDESRKFLRQPFVDWLILTAILEESTVERALEIIRKWMALFEKRRIGDSDDEIVFLSSLAKVLVKKGNDLKKFFTTTEMKELHRYLLITFVMLSESEHGSKLFEGAVQFVAKELSFDDNLFELCFHDLAVHLRGRLSILGIFLRDACSSVCHKIESVIPSICAQLSYHLNNQLLSTAAADFLAELVVCFPTSSDLVQLFMRSLMHPVKRVRFNVLRWFGRIKVTKGSSLFLVVLQRAISELFLLTSDDLCPPCSWEREGKMEWMKEVDRLREQDILDEEQRGVSYLPKGITGATLLNVFTAQSARQKLEELLQISGSCNSKMCPEFDVLYEKLDKAGYDHRVFARHLIDIINLLKCDEDVKTALNMIAETVTRCRLKVVVDHGCSVIDELLSLHRCDENFLSLAEYRYRWAMNCLIDKETECRTLALSRILWSVCEKSQDLLKNSFETFRATLAIESLDRRVHQRILKTLKLFTSKSDCKLPADIVEFLFWHCINVQIQSDFLVRSAATILFGFVVRHITKSRVVPLFCIVSKRDKFWHDIMKRCSLLVTLPSLQRIFLLSFLSCVTLGHVMCYSASVLQTIHSLLVSLVKLLKVTADIRERRFCLEIVVAMSPTAAREKMVKLLEEIRQDHISRVDCDFLMFTLNGCHGDDHLVEACVIPYDLVQSPFVNTIKKCETYTPEEALTEIDQVFSYVEPHSAELGLQAVAVAMTKIAVNMKRMEHVGYQLRESYVAQSIAILEHPLCSSRAVSIISRIPVCLGLTKNYLQKPYLVQILKRWMNSSAM